MKGFINESARCSICHHIRAWKDPAFRASLSPEERAPRLPWEPIFCANSTFGLLIPHLD
jgi:hypothetical protein